MKSELCNEAKMSWGGGGGGGGGGSREKQKVYMVGQHACMELIMNKLGVIYRAKRMTKKHFDQS